MKRRTEDVVFSVVFWVGALVLPVAVVAVIVSIGRP